MNPNCGPKPFDLDAACDKKDYDTESWLQRQSVSIKKGMTRARVSRRQPSKASERLIGLVGWSFGQ